MPGPLCWREAGGRAPRQAGRRERGRRHREARGPRFPPAPRKLRSPGGRRAPDQARPGPGGPARGRLPSCIEIRAWRTTSCGAMGVAGCSLCSALATRSSWPEASSPYRRRSLRNTTAAAVAQSRARMQAFRDPCGEHPPDTINRTESVPGRKESSLGTRLV